MQNLQLDLAAGQSVSIGEYRVTLVSTTDDAATFEIEGPGGRRVRQVMPVSQKTADNPSCNKNVTA